MKLFIYLGLQLLILLPLTTLAAEVGMIPVSKSYHESNTEIKASQKADIKKSYGRLPLNFIKNNGQMAEEVSFYERGARHAAFFTNKGLILSITKRDKTSDKPSFNEGILAFKKAKEPSRAITEAVSLSFIGANSAAKISSSEKMSSRVNYFVGNDKTKWHTNIPTYGVLTYKDIYTNIDIKFYGNNNNMEHDVIVRPGGNYSEVKFAYRGIKGLKVRENGDLEVSLENGTIIEEKPVIYQEIKGERVAVDGSYKILKAQDGVFTYGFSVASYDRTKDLVIDPVLTYSTYFGSLNDTTGIDITVDNTGAAYVTGLLVPAFGGIGVAAFNLLPGTIRGGMDIFVTKINPAGSAYVYSTILGGSSDEDKPAIAVDSTGAAYLTGTTNSADFPLLNPIQGVLSGFADVFVTKIDPTGTAIVYSTYLGGINGENGMAIAVGSTGAAYVTGSTRSSDFPLMLPLQATFSGNTDAFVTEINPSGSALVYSTYLGGSLWDSTNDIALDSTGAAYVTGTTSSTDFPLMLPLQATFGGFTDAFITEINPAGSAITYSTYLGGSNTDNGNSIALDSTGAAYVTGTTGSSDFPLMNPIQAVYGGASSDAFVTEINAAGSALIYSTYLGGAGIDNGNGIAVDSTGAAYVTGTTGSSDFPILNPINAGGLGGLDDAYVTKINPAGTALVYSTYFGGSSYDGATKIAVDSAGAAYITGSTSSTDFPLMNPVQGRLSGTADAFISKIDTAPPAVVTLNITLDAATVVGGSALGYTVTVTNTTTQRQCFQIWENLTLPKAVKFPKTGEMLGPIRRCLNSKGVVSKHLNLFIPMRAPLGQYTLNAFIGAYAFPSTPYIVDEQHLTFNTSTAP